MRMVLSILVLMISLVIGSSEASITTIYGAGIDCTGCKNPPTDNPGVLSVQSSGLVNILRWDSDPTQDGRFFTGWSVTGPPSVSVDFGKTWSRTTGSIGAHSSNFVAVASNGTVQVVDTVGHVYYSIDHGSSYTLFDLSVSINAIGNASSSSMGVRCTGITCVLVGGNSTVFAKIFKTTNAGAGETWALDTDLSASFTTNYQVFDMVLTTAFGFPTVMSPLTANTEKKNLYNSSGWVASPVNTNGGCGQPAKITKNDGTILVYIPCNGPGTSAKIFNQTMTQIISPDYANVNACGVGVNATGADSIMAQGPSGIIYWALKNCNSIPQILYSIDYGNTWKKMSSNIDGGSILLMNMLVVDNDIYFMVNVSGTFTSTFYKITGA